MVCTPWFTIDDLPCQADAAAPGATGLVDRAVDWVNTITGRQFNGVCTLHVRPPTRCGGCTRPSCAGGCGMQEPLDLTRMIPGPIRSIVELEVAGTVLTDGVDYTLDANRWLYPMHGGALSPRWPRQDMNRVDGDIHTWSFTAEYGMTPPLSLLDATKDLACQLLKQANGKKCDLPDQVTSVSSDGLTLQFEVPKDGRVGIPRIDTIIDLFRPTRRSGIIDPAAGRPRIRTV